MKAHPAKALLLGLVLTSCHRDWDAILPAAPGGDASAFPDGLVARWPLDEGMGSTTGDATSRGHDGLITGGVTWIAGHSGQALLLNGVDGVVTVPASPDFDRPATAALTMTAWLLRPAGNDGGPLGTFNTSPVVSVSFQPISGNFSMEAYADTQMSYWDGKEGDPQGALSTVDFGTMTWHHLAVVVTPAPLVTAYFDGKPLASSTPDNTPHVSTQVLLGGNNFGDKLPAAIDEVHYYNRALSADEVQRDMNP